MKSREQTKARSAAPAHTRRPYKTVLRKEQKERTRDRIVQSALKLFSEHGFEGASVRDISADAGVTHAVIRLFFGSKDELWRVAIDRLFARMNEELGYSRWLKSGRLGEAELRRALRDYVHYCARHPEHVRIMAHESLRDTERMRWMANKHLRPVYALLIPLFTRAMQEGLLPKLPLVSLMYIMSSAAQMLFALRVEARHIYGIEVLDPAVVDAHADAVCTLLLGRK